ncbi:MAG: phosphotransferase, partial [Peptococcaceae bacterium]|nr:phosphotransferase [Peptococcaceae bacterium]
PGVYECGAGDILKAALELQAALDENGVAVRVLPGAEYRFTRELLEMCANGDVIYLNRDKRYLLVEFPASQAPPHAEWVFYELGLLGVTPVIAHPERNGDLAGRPDLLHRLVTRGALVQITAGSLTGLFGGRVRKTARQFLSMGWVHFIASDAHSSRGRAPVLSAAFREAASLAGEEAARRLVHDNPLQVVRGGEIPAGTFAAPEARRGLRKIFFFKAR